MVGQSSLSIAYGIDVATRDDPNIALAEDALQGMFVAQGGGTYSTLSHSVRQVHSESVMGDI